MKAKAPGFHVCMVEPDKEFMDKTGVLVARAIVEP